MRLFWTDQRSGSEVWSTLKARGYKAERLGLVGPGDLSRIASKFPVFIDEDGHFVKEVFAFLFDIAFVRGSTRSTRTLETYAESLLSWLSFAEQQRLSWKRPRSAMLAAYRDYMLGTTGTEHRGRPLSRKTVNLRLTVAIEFYKHLGLIECNEQSSRNNAFGSPRQSARSTTNLSHRQSHEFERLKVRMYSKRPRALAVEHCRALCGELHNPYRLMWQWQLCTGLRIGSLVRVTLTGFKRLRSTTQPALSIAGKGGKMIEVHIPDALRRATVSYIDVDRLLAQHCKTASPDDSLFLNTQGRTVTAKAFYRALHRAATRLGIRTHPHQARTTFATFVRDKLEQLQERGRTLDPVKVVQSLLGHATAETTEQYLESIDVPSVDVLHILDELAIAAVRSHG